jgi:hypothetical protein
MAAVVSKKAFKANEEGLLLRKGEHFMTVVESTEQVVTAQQFYVVTVQSTSTHVVAKVNCHDYIVSQEGMIVQHYWSGFPLVSLTPGKQVFVPLSAVKRKVMLLQTDENSTHGFVIDYNRPVQTSPIPVVPCYPEIGDMLCIQGEVLNDVWLGHVKAVNNADQTVSVQFFVPNSIWKGHNLYVKETRNRHVARETVHWKSILGIANGHWITNSTWKKLA